MSSDRRRRSAVILAAGKGTRMRSRRAKVLHEAAGRPLLGWVIEAARAAGCSPIIVVVGHRADEVKAAFSAPDLEWVLQAEQRGTGHALAQAAEAVPDRSTVLVLSGDVPLVSPQTLEALAVAAEAGWGALAVADLDSPGTLGRVLTTAGGRLDRIVEVADADKTELAVRTINSGLYALPAPAIFERLAEVVPDNAQGEIYLTDAVGGAAADGLPVALHRLAEPAEAFGVNDRADLARVHRRLVDRVAGRLMGEGVTLLDPSSVELGPAVRVGRDTVLHPGVSLLGHTEIGEGCVIGRGAWLADCRLADEVTVEPYSVLEKAEVEAGCRVGPFARLRPASVLLTGSKVGNFVEVKNSTLGAGAKAGHLAYLGDSTIGERANIGAGVVTCNYDGERKHRTTIGADAFVGSDTMLVAPVTVGERATTAAGSVITQTVPDGNLGVGRARQRNIDGWAERREAGRAPKDDKKD